MCIVLLVGSEDGSGERVRRCSVNELQDVLVLVVLVYVDRQNGSKDFLNNIGINKSSTGLDYAALSEKT